MDKKIQEFAEELGYKRAEYAGEYNGSKVYDLVYSDEPCCIGLPRYIVVEGENIRASNDEESFEIMRSLYDEDDEE